VDDFSAAAPGGHELGNQLRRILEVAVHQHDGIGVGERQAGGQRRLMAEVARQLDQPEARVVALLPLHDGRRIIRAAVVDVQHAATQLGQGIEHRAQAAMELGQVLLLVEDRDDYGEGRPRRHAWGPGSPAGSRRSSARAVRRLYSARHRNASRRSSPAP
jgi:hypothetical protein